MGSTAPVRIVASADLVGGAPDGEELYCPAVEWDFGDGTSATTTGPTTSHVYTTGPNSVRTVTVTISLTNGQTLVATTQFVLGNF